jgi:hypothetical protein
VIATSTLTATLAPTAALLVAAATLWLNGIRQDRHRRRLLYASALEAVQAYREFAYAVPRRRCEPEHRSEERVRLTEAMRQVQRDLSRYSALLKTERDGAVSEAFEELVAETRRVAGELIHDAWTDPPITSDAEVNVEAPLDFGPILEREAAYLATVEVDLKRSSEVVLWRSRRDRPEEIGG